MYWIWTSRSCNGGMSGRAGLGNSWKSEAT
nr:MAG TPA: hypothetical protein [Caudoviricetes sp.]